MAIRTLDEFQDALDLEIAWRKREMTTLRFATESANLSQQHTFIRAATCMLYAHWEGFVVTAARLYLEYLGRRGLRLGTINLGLVALSLKNDIRAATGSSRTSVHLDLLTKIQTSNDDRLQRNAASRISAESNLNFARLVDILVGVGLHTVQYSDRQVFIDQKVVGRRNAVAHGHEETIELIDYQSAHTGVISLIDDVHSDLLNAAVTRSYRRTPSGS
ncbi:MAG: hypothetical protein IIC94_07980 [Chloroflexi bacterium]|nr:hypothetical protein [Chloroflexota bacterium]